MPDGKASQGTQGGRKYQMGTRKLGEDGTSDADLVGKKLGCKVKKDRKE